MNNCTPLWSGFVDVLYCNNNNTPRAGHEVPCVCKGVK